MKCSEDSFPIDQRVPAGGIIIPLLRLVYTDRDFSRKLCILPLDFYQGEKFGKPHSLYPSPRVEDSKTVSTMSVAATVWAPNRTKTQSLYIGRFLFTNEE